MAGIMVAAPMGPRATGSDSRGERLNKLRILLLALAYACFWSLFVLFPYPANVLPESHASYVAGPVFASNLITLVTMALMGGVLVVFRDSLAERVAGSTAAIVGSGALLLACAAALVASADAGAVPRWMMAAYPAIMALYGVVIALALAAASRRLTPRDNAVVLALSLLLSFLIGEAIVALTDPLPTGDISNPLMFALSSIFLVILGHIGCDAPKAPLPSRLAPSLSGRAAVPATAILLCYLLAAAARGLSVARLLHPLHRLSLLHRPALLAVGCAVPGLDPVKSPHGHHAAVGGGSRGHGSAGPPLVAGCGRCAHAHRGRRLRHPYRRAYRALSRTDGLGGQRRHARHGLRHDAGDALVRAPAP